MSGRIFLDTSGWLAVVNERATNHQAALLVYEEVLRTGGQLLTTNLVVAEMHAMTVTNRGAGPGLRLLDEMRRDPTHDVRYPDRDLQDEAVERWIRGPDGRASGSVTLTDAVSLELMRREGIRAALATNDIFRRAGFRMIPDPTDTGWSRGPDHA